MSGIPKRWKNYLPVGRRVAGTRFLPFKVPLKVELCRHQPKEDWFTPQLLMDDIPNLGAVIDLTDTNRYYNYEDFASRGIIYKKIRIAGRLLPSEEKRQEFFRVVDQLSEQLGHDSDALIGVHCTHGLNRTGYLICKYMVLRMKIDPLEAITNFQEARGYKIERENYVEDVMSKNDNYHDWRREPRMVPEAHERYYYNNSRSRYPPLPNRSLHNATSSYRSRRHYDNYYFSNRHSNLYTNREHSHTRRHY